VKIVVCADVHLDSRLRGLDAYEGAPADAIRGASRLALGNVIKLAIEERAVALLVPGDLFDGDWADYGTGLHFAAEMKRLGKAGIRAFVAWGNHDAESNVSRRLAWPDNVHVFPSDRAATERFEVEGLRLAIHGRSFPRPDVTENLATTYPAPVEGFLNVGMLHTALEGDALHARYAPCSPAELVARGYQGWALGHVHQRRKVEAACPIVYPGNLQGRHVRETGPKGCAVFTVEDRRIVDVAFPPADVLRWDVAEVDVSSATDLDAVARLAADSVRGLLAGADGLPLACRVRLRGRTELHDEVVDRLHELANSIRATAPNEAWIEKVEARTAPCREEGTPTADRTDALAEVERTLREIESKPELVAELLPDLGKLAEILPAELRNDPEGPIRPGDPDWVQARIAEARSILTRRLAARREEDA